MRALDQSLPILGYRALVIAAVLALSCGGSGSAADSAGTDSMPDVPVIIGPDFATAPDTGDSDRPNSGHLPTDTVLDSGAELLEDLPVGPDPESDTYTAPDPGPGPDTEPASDPGPGPDTEPVPDPGPEQYLDSGSELLPDTADPPTDTGPDSQTLPATVVIDEVMMQPMHGHPVAGQYVELWNRSAEMADLEGWALRADDAVAPITAVNGTVLVAAGDRLVLGGSADPLVNSYAHVVQVWPQGFSLPPVPFTLSLIDASGAVRDSVVITAAFPVFPGSSIERVDPDKPASDPANWQRAPSLITFLGETGLFAGDRGSPEDPTFRIVNEPAVAPGPAGVETSVGATDEAHRFPAPVKAGDLLDFWADVDRVSGDLDVFLTLLDSTGAVVSDVAFDDSLLTRDFRIFFTPVKEETLTAQVQADFFFPFESASVTLRVLVADVLELDVPKAGLVLEAGKSRELKAIARFSADPDAGSREVPVSDLVFESSAETVAKVLDGKVVAVGKGTAQITATRHGGSLDISTVFSVTVWEATANDTCGDAIDVTAGGTFDGSTLGGQDDYTPKSCVFMLFSGPDLVYSVSPSADRKYRFTVTPAGSFDPFLYVYDACPPGKCVTGTVLNGPEEPETLEVTVKGGQTAWLVVDGETGDAGAFTLEVE